MRVFSDATYVFDAALLHEVLIALGAALDPMCRGPSRKRFGT
jgi:hypothetical protein